MDDGDPVAIPIDGTLDLHAFAPRDVASVVVEYVTACHHAGLSEVRLVHGRGKGVQRAVVQRVLASHPLVFRYWDAPESHLGATVVRICNTDGFGREALGRPKPRAD